VLWLAFGIGQPVAGAALAIVLACAGIVATGVQRASRLDLHEHTAPLTRLAVETHEAATVIHTVGGAAAIQTEFDRRAADLARVSRRAACWTASLAAMPVVVVGVLAVGLTGIESPFWALCFAAVGATATVRAADTASELGSARDLLARCTEPLLLSAPTKAPRPPLRPAHGGRAIELREASAELTGVPILDRCSVRIAAGETVAIVGPSGAGKSSIASVLVGRYPLSAGEVLIDGKRLDAAALRAYARSQCAWIAPDAYIYDCGVEANLLARPETDEDALETAHLLGRRARHLSAGEAQKVRLMRGVLKRRPEVAILDEPLRGMPHHARAEVTRWLLTQLDGTTRLLITHDIASTLVLPRVLVIDGGSIVEDGAPHVLAARPSRFRDLLEAERRSRTVLAGDRHVVLGDLASAGVRA
jgi:ABC-type transport system involved in cytochrome bd biosynthesis fused ATPase/permease subunit